LVWLTILRGCGRFATVTATSLDYDVGELSWEDVMNRLILAGAAVGALLTGSATAADMRIRKAPPPPPAPPVFFSWTGCYIGGHIGGLWAEKEWFVRDPNFPEVFGQSEGTHDADGFLGGVQAGCDYQFAGGFVIGIAADYAWTDAEGSNVSLVFGDENHSKVESLASVTGRIGYAWDRFLLYVKGGGAWEEDEYHYINSDIGRASETRSGWTVGVGGEYAFTNFLTGFIEYNYYDFGTRDLTFVEPDAETYIAGIDETKSVLKAGLNFRFGGWGKTPVVARY
jgi:outer membrane immunogenic protein